MAPPTRRCLVVGAGIFGASSALEIHRRGWQVRLLDPGPVPRPLASSTDRSKVVRMDYGSDVELTTLARRAMEGWRRWNLELFSRPLFHETGFLVLTSRTLEEGGYEAASLATLDELGEPAHRLDEELRERHPAWRWEAWADGYLSPRAGWVESGEAVRELVERAEGAGVELVEARATALRQSGGRVTGVVTEEGGTIEADAVVVAAGAWTPGLLPWLAADLSSVGMPVFFFRPSDPEPWRGERFPVWAADLARTGWYGFPAGADGVVKVGHHGRGLAGDPEEPPTVDAAWVTRCREFLATSLPGLAEAPLVGTRTCFYCDARDGDFWIASDPDRPGLVVASGGSGHGFKFGPVLGELAAAALEGDHDPRLRRFRWRPGAEPGKEEARYIGE